MGGLFFYIRLEGLIQAGSYIFLTMVGVLSFQKSEQRPRSKSGNGPALSKRLTGSGARRPNHRGGGTSGPCQGTSYSIPSLARGRHASPLRAWAADGWGSS